MTAVSHMTQLSLLFEVINFSDIKDSNVLSESAGVWLNCPSTLIYGNFFTDLLTYLAIGNVGITYLFETCNKNSTRVT